MSPFEYFRSYFKFDIDDLKASNVDQIINASFSIDLKENNCTDKCKINIKEINDLTFDQLLTKKRSHLEMLYQKEDIIDYELISSTDTDYFLRTNPNDYLYWNLFYDYEFNLTELFRKWIKESNPSGLIEIGKNLELNPDGSIQPSFQNYIIFDNTTTDEQFLGPKLVIDYSVAPKGMSDLYTYHSQAASYAGTGFTNDYTGNQTFIHQDYVPFGNNFSFGISHLFDNINRTSNIGYGNGWKLNFNNYLVGNLIIEKYVRSDGSEVYFKMLPDCPTYINDNYKSSSGNSTTCFISEDGSNLYYMYESGTSQNYRKIIYPNELIITFNSNSQIYTDYLTNQSYTVYFLDTKYEKVSNIVDSLGNIATFVYKNNLLDYILIERMNE